MIKTSLLQDIKYGDHKPVITLLMESESAKEIRITFRKGQEMKKHNTIFPISVEIFEGEIGFGVEGIVHVLKKGDIISLPAHIFHDLVATKDSIVRLTLSKMDSIKRVQDLVENKSVPLE